jgi:DNA-binding transcriptional ArsR family regulator
MPNQQKAKLILHPIRLQILHALGEKPRTTRQLIEILPGLPAPSIYRHLRQLLEGGIIEVAETRRVRGAEEKTYRPVQPARLTQEDVAGMSLAEHQRHFNAFAAILIQSFADYLKSAHQTAADAGFAAPDFLADRAGFSEVTFYATASELDEFRETLNQALAHLASLPPDPTRRRRKLAFISHPICMGE